METPVRSGDKLYTHDDNLETFSLVWLDADVNKNEASRDTLLRLRAIINHLRTFDDGEKCQQYIRSMSKENRLMVIVSDQFGQEFVPRIHQLRQVSSIYVFCVGEKKSKQWTKEFQKIRTVTSRSDKLIWQIESDQKLRLKIEEPLAMKMFSKNDELGLLTITGFDNACVHFQVLINVLLRMKSDERDRNELISLFKKEYKGNKSQLAIIREFEQNYSPDTALEWYNRQSFFQKILNKALRVQNIDVLFLFRSFIRHIFLQLQQVRCKSSVQAYKGQLMSYNEFEFLKNSVGKFVSVNSFLSAGVDRELVLSNLEETTSSDKMQRVLFVIDADPHVAITKPFAKISSSSGVPNEDEILFMLGSIFRLTDIRRNKKQTWIIRMTMCGEHEPELKNFFEYLGNEYGYGETNLLALGAVLRDMDKFDLAEKYYSRMLSELPSNDPWLAALYPSLGLVAKDKGDYDKSLEWYHKALEIYIRTRPSDYFTIGDTYNAIGVLYQNKNHHNRALKYYNQAVSLFKKVHAEKHPMMALFYNNIGAVYEEQRNYLEALAFYEKSLEIKKKHFPKDHPDLGRSHVSIAAVHGYLNSYDIALENYKKALQIQLKSLSLQHPDIAVIYANMGAVYAASNRFQQALTYWQKANAIFRDTLPSQHPLVVKLDEEIQRVSSKLAHISLPKINPKVRLKPIRK